MPRDSSVPSRHPRGIDVPSNSEEHFLHPSRSRPISTLESPSRCPVSSSSTDDRRSTSRKRKEYFEEDLSPSHPTDLPPAEGNNDFRPENGVEPGTEEQLLEAAEAMVYDATNNFRSNRNGCHRRFTSPHADGIPRKASNKPQMEKRRRKRINDSVEELRKYISEVFSVDPSRHDKLEKADILEMTVKYLRHIKSKWVITDRNEMNTENRQPLRLESKNRYNNVSPTFRGCVGGIRDDTGERVDLTDIPEAKFNNTVNKQPVTLIIQAAPQSQILQPHQNVPRDQYLVGFNTNSMGVQPTVVPGNTYPPVIQLNIMNSISPTNEPSLVSTPTYVPPTPDKVYGSPISPDTTTKDLYQDIIYGDYPLGCKEGPNSYDDKPPQYDEVTNNNKQFLYSDPNQIFLRTTCLQPLHSASPLPQDPLTPKNTVTPRRPIAPKPTKRAESPGKVRMDVPKMNQEAPEQQEPVWRPWDANRKILKPHMVH